MPICNYHKNSLRNFCLLIVSVLHSGSKVIKEELVVGTEVEKSDVLMFAKRDAVACLSRKDCKNVALLTWRRATNAFRCESCNGINLLKIVYR